MRGWILLPALAVLGCAAPRWVPAGDAAFPIAVAVEADGSDALIVTATITNRSDETVRYRVDAEGEGLSLMLGADPSFDVQYAPPPPREHPPTRPPDDRLWLVDARTESWRIDLKDLGDPEALYVAVMWFGDGTSSCSRTVRWTR
jgi:hypothetical protein